MSQHDSASFEPTTRPDRQRLDLVSDALFNNPPYIPTILKEYPEIASRVLAKMLADLDQAAKAGEDTRLALSRVAAVELDILLAEHGIGIDPSILDEHQLTELEHRLGIDAEKPIDLTAAYQQMASEKSTSPLAQRAMAMARQASSMPLEQPQEAGQAQVLNVAALGGAGLAILAAQEQGGATPTSLDDDVSEAQRDLGGGIGVSGMPKPPARHTPKTGRPTAAEQMANERRHTAKARRERWSS
ncbi:hypothetical protein KC878_00245 [Candidatus Saccharibacteria bacterium]|nr:hypothetical protein [Candidatus Saccharibacteria bacterium]MCB9821044.1 hypothetical protein [Candidatus Nomurabacteria bacterium]